MATHGKTCMPCRVRKVKCDGDPEQCGPCRRSRKGWECTYNKSAHIDNTQRRDALQRGEACAPCRKKKKRCNAARPSCETCKIARKEDECVYSNILSADKTNKDQCRIESAVRQGDVMNRALVSIQASSIRAASSFPRRIITPFVGSTPDPLLPPPNHMQNIFLSLCLTDYDPYASAVSDISPTDLNMTFRLFFLAHRSQLGFRFTSAKQEAILSGDLSNTIIHPFFIHFAHLFGCNMYQEHQGRYSYLLLLDAHLHFARDALLSMKEGNDPLAFAQACFLMFLVCIYNHNIYLGNRYMKLAAETIKRNDIRFVPRRTVDYMANHYINSPVSEFSEEVHERVSFLSEVLYSEVDLLLLTGGKETALLDLYTQFQQELPNAYPQMFKICPNTIRVKSVLSAQGAAQLLSLYKPQTMLTSGWSSSCKTYISSLKSDVADIRALTGHFMENNDIASCISLHYSTFAYAIPLGEIDKILKKHVLSIEYADMCREALHDVEQIIKDIPHEDLTFLNQFIQMCWSRASSFFGGEELPATAVARAWSPLNRRNSVFANASILLMAQSQSKLASIRLDWGQSGSVCDKLEAARQRRCSIVTCQHTRCEQSHIPVVGGRAVAQRC